MLNNVSWETYEKLLEDLADSSAPRLTFDRGTLEIMSPTFEHERFNRLLASFVEEAAEDLDVDIENAGSTTFRRLDLDRGVEPDSCFYISNAERVLGKRTVNLSTRPSARPRDRDRHHQRLRGQAADLCASRGS